MLDQQETKYFLIRHASAERSEPDKDRLLDQTGVEQAKQLREVLTRHEYGSGVVISSRALRAQATAAIANPARTIWPRIEIEPLYTRDPRMVELITVAHGVPKDFLKMDAEGDNLFLHYATAATDEIKEIADTKSVDAVFIFGHGETLNKIGLLLCGDPDNKLLNTTFPDYAEGFIVEGTEVRELKRAIQPF